MTKAKITQQQMHNLHSALAAQRGQRTARRPPDREDGGSTTAKSLFGQPLLFAASQYPHGVSPAEVIDRLEHAIANSEVALHG